MIKQFSYFLKWHNVGYLLKWFPSIWKKLYLNLKTLEIFKEQNGRLISFWNLQLFRINSSSNKTFHVPFMTQCLLLPFNSLWLFNLCLHIKYIICQKIIGVKQNIKEKKKTLGVKSQSRIFLLSFPVYPDYKQRIVCNSHLTLYTGIYSLNLITRSNRCMDNVPFLVN